MTDASGNVGTAPGPPFDHVRWRRIDVTSQVASDELRRAFTGVDAVVHLARAIQPVRHEHAGRALVDPASPLL